VGRHVQRIAQEYIIEGRLPDVDRIVGPLQHPSGVKIALVTQGADKLRPHVGAIGGIDIASLIQIDEHDVLYGKKHDLLEGNYVRLIIAGISHEHDLLVAPPLVELESTAYDASPINARFDRMARNRIENALALQRQKMRRGSAQMNFEREIIFGGHTQLRGRKFAVMDGVSILDAVEITCIGRCRSRLDDAPPRVNEVARGDDRAVAPSRRDGIRRSLVAARKPGGK